MVSERKGEGTERRPQKLEGGNGDYGARGGAKAEKGTGRGVVDKRAYHEKGGRDLKGKGLKRGGGHRQGRDGRTFEIGPKSSLLILLQEKGGRGVLDTHRKGIVPQKISCFFERGGPAVGKCGRIPRRGIILHRWIGPLNVRGKGKSPRFLRGWETARRF